MLTKVEFWRRDGAGWELDHVRTGGSKRWGELCAADILRPYSYSTTRYVADRDSARAPYCVVATPDGGRSYFEPEAYVVPSVGELGWSP